MIDTRTKDTFWLVVQDCLREIHGPRQSEASNVSADLRERIEHPPSGMSTDIFYHSEPFDVACDITEKRLELRDYRPIYDEMVSKRGW